MRLFSAFRIVVEQKGLTCQLRTRALLFGSLLTYLPIVKPVQDLGSRERSSTCHEAYQQALEGFALV